MATIRKNITLDTETYKNFCKIAERKGIRMSTWINERVYRRRTRKGYRKIINV